MQLAYLLKNLYPIGLKQQLINLKNKFFQIYSLIVISSIVIPLFSVLLYYDFDQSINFSNYVFSISFFTFYQSIISATLTVILGSFFAYLLVKHDYIFGISYLINSLSILFVLPSIISVFGILSFYGNIINIYGLHGILLAHSILNVPLVTRVMIQSLIDISPNEKNLGNQMGLGRVGIFFASEWPIIKKNIPSLFVLVSFICFVSFTPVLILGGSPKYSTIEVAIYQSVIFLNNYNLATNLLFLQIFICSFIFLFFFKSFKNDNFILDDHRRNINNLSYSIKYFFDYLLIFLFTILIYSPIFYIIITGINDKLITVLQSSFFLKSLYTTFIISFFSGLLAIFLTYGNLGLIYKSKKKKEFWFYILIIFSPGIMSVGYYIFINEILSIKIPNIVIVIVINTIFILPFSYNYLSPTFFRVSREHQYLSESLNLYGFKKFISVDLFRLKVPLINTFCISSILSSSDLVIVSFFGTNDLSTLTQTIYRLLGNYRIDEAKSLSFIFLIYCFLYFVIPKIFLSRNYKNAPFN